MKTLVTYLFVILIIILPSICNAQVPNVAGFIGISGSKNAGYTSPNLIVGGQVRVTTKKKISIQEEVVVSGAKKQYIGNGYTFASTTDIELKVTNNISAAATLEIKDTHNTQFNKLAFSPGALVKFNYKNTLYPYARVSFPDNTQNKSYSFSGGIEYYQPFKNEDYGIVIKTEATIQKYKQFPYPNRQTAYGISTTIGFYKRIGQK